VKERYREREGERIVKVQVLDFWVLAFGRSFCCFVFGEEKKSIYLRFFCVLFWVLVFVCFDFVRSFFLCYILLLFLFLGEVVFCMLGFTVRWFFEVLQNPEEL
jgi:hypothetical protein